MQDLSLASAAVPSNIAPTALRVDVAIDEHSYSPTDNFKIPAFSDVISGFSHSSDIKASLGHEEPSPTIVALPLQLSWQLKNAINNSTNTKEKRKQKDR